jgi:hypothetical protein
MPEKRQVYYERIQGSHRREQIAVSPLLHCACADNVFISRPHTFSVIVMVFLRLSHCHCYACVDLIVCRHCGAGLSPPRLPILTFTTQALQFFSPTSHRNPSKFPPLNSRNSSSQLNSASLQLWFVYTLRHLAQEQPPHHTLFFTTPLSRSTKCPRALLLQPLQRQLVSERSRSRPARTLRTSHLFSTTSRALPAHRTLPRPPRPPLTPESLPWLPPALAQLPTRSRRSQRGALQCDVLHPLQS